jgi:ABC-type branched-subunit amino acid transport system substrate-binding protein
MKVFVRPKRLGYEGFMRLRSCVHLLIALAGILGVAVPQGHSETSPLKIGAILPLTGSSAMFGLTCKAAIEQALSELPVDERSRVSVVYEDDGLVASRSVAAGQKLLNVDKIDALISWSSSTALSMVALTERKKIPHLSIASDPAVAVGRSYSFTYWALPEDEAKTLYEHLVGQGKRRVAIIAVTHNGLLAVRDAFARLAATDNRIEIVSSEEVGSDVQDFRGVLERIRSRGSIDAFIPIFFPGQLGVVVRQARGGGITAPIFGFETFEDYDEIKASAGLFSGVVYATGADPAEVFVKKFKGTNPDANLYSASNCYDCAQLLVKASQVSSDPDAQARFLRSLRSYPTASGSISSTGDNRFSLPTVLKTIDASGEPKPL